MTIGSLLADCRTLARSPRFHDLVAGLIVVNATIIGLETMPRVVAAAGP